MAVGWEPETYSGLYIAAGTAKTLSMEVFAAPATPSPAATPRPGANTGQRSPRSTRSSCASSRKRGNEFESNGTSKAWLSSPDSQWMVMLGRKSFQSI
jgi:hypothetical protein